MYEKLISALTKNKKDNLQLAGYYRQIEAMHPFTVTLVGACASNIYAMKYSDDRIKILSINFCHDKLCPICIQNRYRHNKDKYEAVYDNLKRKHPSLIYVDLVITIRNCAADDLQSSIEHLEKGFAAVLVRPEINCRDKQSMCKGYVKSVHVKYAGDYFYHPHIHAVLAFDSRYSRGENYISKKKWQSICKECLDVDYAPAIKVKQILPGGKTHKADICHILEYTEKHFEAKDYCGDENNRSDEENISVIETYRNQIKPYQKLFSNGGELRIAIGVYNKQQKKNSKSDIEFEQRLSKQNRLNLRWNNEKMDYVSVRKMF